VNSIPEFARQAGIQIVAPASQLDGVKTGAIKGNFEIRLGLNELLRGTRLLVASSDDQTIVLRAPRKNVEAAPTEKGAAASGGGASGLWRSNSRRRKRRGYRYPYRPQWVHGADAGLRGRFGTA
jgi:hypothetical protein